MNQDLDTRPWYRQFWPWFLFGLPGVAVVAGIATVIIATLGYDGLVADDYYKQGLAINVDLEKDRVARHLGLNAQMEFDLRQGWVRVDLDSEVAIPPQELSLSLIHPTRADADLHLQLSPAGTPGRYEASFAPQQHAIHWNLLLSSASGDWRLQGRYPGGYAASARLAADS
ncbi:MAG: FixH family protein [Gammaproteobacteria bacterium]|nr:FixH family protein [Gammaproteobacteria bacterium]